MIPRPLDRPSDVDPIWFAGNRARGRFHNPWEAPPLPGPRELLRWQMSANPHRARKRQRPALPVVGDPLDAFAARRGPKVLWLGHASVLVELDGMRVLVDPVFGRAGGVVRRLTPCPVGPADVPELDAVLITHGHHDHLCRRSVRALARRFGDRTAFFVPAGMGRMMPRACRKVVEFDWWHTVPLGPVEIGFVPAQHWHRRGIADENRALWGGWVLRGSQTVYHSGDTGWFGGFGAIGRTLGPIDLAVLPIGAYEPVWFMSSQHMSPTESVASFEALGARHFLAMHWGTFDLSDEPVDAGPEVLEAVVAARGLSPDRFFVAQHGATLALGERPEVSHRHAPSGAIERELRAPPEA